MSKAGFRQKYCNKSYIKNSGDKKVTEKGTAVFNFQKTFQNRINMGKSVR